MSIKLTTEFSQSKAYYLPLQEVMQYCQSSKTIQKTCNEKFWYNWWKNKPQSFTYRSEKILSMLTSTSDDKINWSFFKGSLKAGIDLNIPDLLNQVLDNNHLRVLKIILDYGAIIPEEIHRNMEYIPISQLTILKPYLFNEDNVYLLQNIKFLEELSNEIGIYKLAQKIDTDIVLNSYIDTYTRESVLTSFLDIITRNILILKKKKKNKKDLEKLQILFAKYKYIELV
jgi:hypothetical protein